MQQGQGFESSAHWLQVRQWDWVDVNTIATCNADISLSVCPPHSLSLSHTHTHTHTHTHRQTDRQTHRHTRTHAGTQARTHPPTHTHTHHHHHHHHYHQQSEQNWKPSQDKIKSARTCREWPSLAAWFVPIASRQATYIATHSEHRFPAPSSKLWQI